MQKITPFLWFDGQAEEAMNFYTSIFKDSKKGVIRRFGKGAPGPEGSVLTASFQLNGMDFVALNGGPHYKFTPAISFFVSCEDQQEVDYYWDKLLEGGQSQQCGWLTDRFGVSWQIVPRELEELLHDPDPEKSSRVMQAMLQMVKLDLDTLRKAHAG